MTSLLDIAPQTEAVQIADKTIEVRGLALAEIVRLVGRFPHLRGLFDGNAPDWSDLFAMLGDAVGPVIAAGCGHYGEAAYEAAAARLPTEHAVAILAAVKRLTMPSGIGPFVERLRGLVQLSGGGDSSPSTDEK